MDRFLYEVLVDSFGVIFTEFIGMFLAGCYLWLIVQPEGWEFF